jgi:spermidine/putrescine transport system permease protein
LQRAGLLHRDLNFLYSYKAVLMGIVYNYLPLMVFPLYVSLERLDKRLLEAAKDLGAGRLRAFRRVTVPLTMPGILTGCLLVFIPLMGDEFVSAHDWAFGSALGMSVIVLLLVLITVYFRVARRGAAAGAAL